MSELFLGVTRDGPASVGIEEDPGESLSSSSPNEKALEAGLGLGLREMLVDEEVPKAFVDGPALAAGLPSEKDSLGGLDIVRCVVSLCMASEMSC